MSEGESETFNIIHSKKLGYTFSFNATAKGTNPCSYLSCTVKHNNIDYTARNYTKN